MGHGNGKKVSLERQMRDKFASMLAVGQSKKQAQKDGTSHEHIYSYSTYNNYIERAALYCRWLEENHPDCTSLKTAKRKGYYREYLQSQMDRGLSAWTINLDVAALDKLYQISPDDPEKFLPPERRREDITRSRLDRVRDKHFSEANNQELIHFCRGTGARRAALERLEGRDYWTREKMQAAVRKFDGQQLNKEGAASIAAMKEALETFPEQQDFILWRKDKGGRYRCSPIIGEHKQDIIDRMKRTGPKEKVWQYVHQAADVHAYRSDYATAIYRMYSRPPESIPYYITDENGRHRNPDLYICKGDEAGKRLDRAAMLKSSKALGHNRVSVVASNYLRGI